MNAQEEIIKNIEKCEELWRSEYNELLLRLECVHSAFRFLVDNSRPTFDYICDTACVLFNTEDKTFSFHINPEFWYSNPSSEFRAFVISHESYHVFMDHGLRSVKLNHDIANIAQDIVINELLANQFFDRKIIDPEDRYCWYDTVLKDIPHQKGENFEYYYKLLMNNQDSLVSKGLIGSHNIPSGSSGGNATTSDMPTSERPITRNDIDDFIEKINAEEGEGTIAGNLPGGVTISVGKIDVQKKKKWESVIHEWVGLRLKKKEKVISHWIGKDRRMTLLDNVLMIPSSREVEEKDLDKDMIDLWFFQDTSGSCMSFAKRFFKAAKSIPTDRFNVRTFCFDTQVYETDLSSGKLYGFGGTKFNILEAHIERELANKNLKKYPDAIFIITDGDGNNIHPKHPDRWYWFLGGSYITKRYIPPASTTYMLKDFE